MFVNDIKKNLNKVYEFSKRRVSILSSTQNEKQDNLEKLTVNELRVKFEQEQKHRMNHRSGRKKCMLYPEDRLLDNWNIFITFILLFTSIFTPLRIAFVE